MYDSASTGTTGMIFLVDNGGNTNFEVQNSAGFAQGYATETNPQGVWTATRTAAAVLDMYKNGSSTSRKNGTSTSTSPATGVPFFIGARNTGGTPDNFTGDQIAIVAFGSGLTGVNAAQLHTDLNTYMTALGTNVY